MTIKYLFGIWEEKVPVEIQNEVESKLAKMKLHAVPTMDMSRSSVICYFLVDFIRREIDDRVCRILLLIEVLDCSKQCGLGFDKELYCEVELMVSVVEEPLQDVLTNFLKEIKK